MAWRSQQGMTGSNNIAPGNRRGLGHSQDSEGDNATPLLANETPNVHGGSEVGLPAPKLPLAGEAFPANVANTSAFAKVFSATANRAIEILAPSATPTKRRATAGSIFQRTPTVKPGPGASFAASARALHAHCDRTLIAESTGPRIGFATSLEDTEMDDYGRSTPDRRQGGPGGRKRRFREDDGVDRRQAPAPYPQKRRFEESWATRVRKQIFTIADSPLRDPQEDVVAISKNIVENLEDTYFRNHIADNTLQLAVEQPFKIPFAAAIVLYTNEKGPEFAKLVLEKCKERLQNAIDEGEWRTFKLLLRFLGSMQTLFQGDGVFPLLEELFNRAADLQTASSDDVLGIELVKIIMLSIPFVLASPVHNAKQHAGDLLSKTDIIASASREMDAVIDPHVSIDGKEIPLSQSVVGMLQRQLQAEAENDWKLDLIPKLFQASEEPSDGVDGSPDSKHPFPEIVLPQKLNSGPRPLFPELYFSLYADQDVETVPPTSSLAATLLRDALVDTINLLDFNRSVSAKFLIDIDCYWSPGTFVKRATPFDKVKDIAGGASTWKPEDLAVDAIFSQMLQLPAPEHRLVYYHSMITETCKLAAGSIAPSLGRAIRYLYRNLDLMDLELSYRFLDWFAHHLSNFDFRWKWVEWLDDVDLSDLHPRKAFIIGVLDKEIRLSFAKRVRDTLPDPYHLLVPASKDNDIPDFKFKDETTPHSTEAKRIVGLLKRKAPETDIQPVIDSIHEAETSNAAADPMLACIDAYVTALCYIGSKSLSHVLSYIERGKERLTNFGPMSPGAPAQIIGSVVGYWREVQPGVAVNIVDKLLNYMILSPASVVEWALAPERLDGGRVLAVTWIYEMVERTLGKVAGRVRQIVAARMQEGLPREQADVLEKALVDEAQAMRELFTFIDDALAGVAGGAEEGMLEGDVDEGDVAVLRGWGVKWRRTFARKLVVEEMVIREAEKMFPVPVEEGMVVDGVGDGDGAVGETNGMGNGGVGDGDGDWDGAVAVAVDSGSGDEQDGVDDIM